MSLRLTAAYLVVASCLLSQAAGQPVPAIARQVRSSSRWGLDLIEEGRRRSPSFRRLLESLGETNVVVYVERATATPGISRAVTEFVALAGPARYLRVRIAEQAGRKELIALVGHELQHALEIGCAADVVDVATLDAFYRRNGQRSVDGFDTPAARRAGTAILQELWAGEDPVPSPLVTRN